MEPEEKVEGQPIDESAPESTPESTPQESKETAPATPVKSPEDLSKMVEDAQSHIGRLSSELGELRQYKSLAEQLLQERQRQAQQAPAQPEKAFEFDYENPIKSMDTYLEHKLSKEREKMQHESNRRMVLETQQRFERGKRTAYETNPRLFKGIEKDVEGVVFQSVRSGIVQPWEVDDPKTWETAATVLAASRKDYSRLMPDKVTPVSPTPTETPSYSRSASSGDIEVTLDEADKTWAKEQNITEEQAKEIIKKEYLAKRRTV